MTPLLILMSCAHQRAPKTAALDGAWSNEEAGFFVEVEGAETTPAVWVIAGSSGELWEADSPSVLDDGGLQFGSPRWEELTLTMMLLDRSQAVLTARYEGSSREDVIPLARTEPRGRAALEQQLADQAHAEMVNQTASNLDGIKTAEMAYHAAFDEYLPMPVWPRPVEDLTPDAVPWPQGGSFDILGWAPDGEVRGTFMVEVAEDGSDFTAHGWQDLDGDGVPAHWTATKDTQAVRVSEPGVE